VRPDNVRLLGSVQLEAGEADCLTSLDSNINRCLEVLLPWCKEPARNRVVVLYANIANLLPCSGVFGQRMPKAVVFSTRRLR
jgi:hypothetical protein